MSVACPGFLLVTPQGAITRACESAGVITYRQWPLAAGGCRAVAGTDLRWIRRGLARVTPDSGPGNRLWPVEAGSLDY